MHNKLFDDIGQADPGEYIMQSRTKLTFHPISSNHFNIYHSEINFCPFKSFQHLSQWINVLSSSQFKLLQLSDCGRAVSEGTGNSSLRWTLCFFYPAFLFNVGAVPLQSSELSYSTMKRGAVTLIYIYTNASLVSSAWIQTRKTGLLQQPI